MNLTSISSNPVQLDVFPDRLYLRRSDPERNMNRYYFMTVQRDLFGGASLIREWGRIGSPGRVQIMRHEDEGRAVNKLAEFAQEKRRRGYELGG